MLTECFLFQQVSGTIPIFQRTFCVHCPQVFGNIGCSSKFCGFYMCWVESDVIRHFKVFRKCLVKLHVFKKLVVLKDSDHIQCFQIACSFNKCLVTFNSHIRCIQKVCFWSPVSKAISISMITMAMKCEYGDRRLMVSRAWIA